ncbi:hypothetical protein PIB30_047285, partial [Stylosanthes scabra]|nr:hypothetical protein [Stylosanthes scabra]
MGFEIVLPVDGLPPTRPPIPPTNTHSMLTRLKIGNTHPKALRNSDTAHIQRPTTTPISSIEIVLPVDGPPPTRPPIPPTNTHSMLTRSKTGNTHPKALRNSHTADIQPPTTTPISGFEIVLPVDGPPPTCPPIPPTNTHPMLTRSKTGNTHPKALRNSDTADIQPPTTTPISGFEIVLPVDGPPPTRPHIPPTNTHSMLTRSKIGNTHPKALQNSDTADIQPPTTTPISGFEIVLPVDVPPPTRPPIPPTNTHSMLTRSKTGNTHPKALRNSDTAHIQPPTTTPISGIEIVLSVDGPPPTRPPIPPTNTHSMLTCSKTGNTHPKALRITNSTSNSESHILPKSVTHALQIPKCKEAMITEYKNSDTAHIQRPTTTPISGIEIVLPVDGPPPTRPPIPPANTHSMLTRSKIGNTHPKALRNSNTVHIQPPTTTPILGIEIVLPVDGPPPTRPPIPPTNTHSMLTRSKIDNTHPKALRDEKAIICKWVYAVKNNAKGELIRYKVGLVARGDVQTAVVDFDQNSDTADIQPPTTTPISGIEIVLPVDGPPPTRPPIPPTNTHSMLTRSKTGIEIVLPVDGPPPARPPIPLTNTHSMLNRSKIGNTHPKTLLNSDTADIQPPTTTPISGIEIVLPVDGRPPARPPIPPTNTHSMLTRSKIGNTHPKALRNSDTADIQPPTTTPISGFEIVLLVDGPPPTRPPIPPTNNHSMLTRSKTFLPVDGPPPTRPPIPPTNTHSMLTRSKTGNTHPMALRNSDTAHIQPPTTTPISGIEIVLPVDGPPLTRPPIPPTNTHSMLTRSKIGNTHPKALRDEKAISCKWVYAVKNNAKGELIRYRAGLVARGIEIVLPVDGPPPARPPIAPTNTHSMLTRSKIGNTHPKALRNSHTADIQPPTTTPISGFEIVLTVHGPPPTRPPIPPTNTQTMLTRSKTGNTHPKALR